MATIHILPVTVQNKIAAGEVIERPASVVKELVENAIDAGAGHIAVDMEEGGHRLIRVADDGHGMSEDDLIASMQRHATSKIHDVDDIFRIGTFGFRGEAIPSIGAVSRMRIATCLPGEREGHEIQVEGGKLVRVVPSQPGKGTRIEVRDIFFNTPARRKFLSRPSSENTRAAEILTRLALGNPTLGFRLRVGDRLVLAFEPAQDQLERIRQIWGDAIADGMTPFGHDIAEGLAVGGYFLRPPARRANSKDIYTLVNKRWIRFFGLARAAADAFQGVLPPREYPFAIINIAVDPSRVDVNAHPTKEEVRFEQEGVIISSVRRSIREALAELASVPTLDTVSGESALPAFPSPASGRDKYASGSNRAASDAHHTTPDTRHGALSPARNGRGTPLSRGSSSSSAGETQQALEMPGSLARPGGGDFSTLDLDAVRQRLRNGDRENEGLSATFNSDSSTPEGQVTASGMTETTNTVGAGTTGTYRVDAAGGIATGGEANGAGVTGEALSSQVSEPGALRLGAAGRHRILGQAGGKYILVDGPDGLLLVDPHALHERWNFDRLVEERQRGGSSRRLLVPLEMRLSPAESAAAEEAVPALAEFGFEFAMPRPDRLSVTAAPVFLPPTKLESLVRQVLADSGEAGQAVLAARDKVLASLACRSSVLLGKTLPEEEMLSLLDKFFNKGQLPTCPHGRPTAIRIGWDELARRFGR